MHRIGSICYRNQRLACTLSSALLPILPPVTHHSNLLEPARAETPSGGERARERTEIGTHLRPRQRMVKVILELVVLWQAEQVAMLIRSCKRREWGRRDGEEKCQWQRAKRGVKPPSSPSTFASHRHYSGIAKASNITQQRQRYLHGQHVVDCCASDGGHISRIESRSKFRRPHKSDSHILRFDSASTTREKATLVSYFGRTWV
jgi:hypothetical protein